MRKSYPSYPLLTMAGLILAGSCSIIAEVDRTKIPTEGTTPGEGGQGRGGNSGTGGTAGNSGTAGTAGTAGTGGDGGMGGEPAGGTAGTGGDAGGGTGGDGGAGDGGGGTGGAPAADCGNGDVEMGEDCDDGDAPANGDGCSTICAEEPGWNCLGEPSACTTSCGDGVMAGQEVCDDGNANACGTCNLACTTATPSAPATGTITLGATAKDDIIDGDYFTLNDGTNAAVEFEFDPAPDAAAGSRVPIDFDPAGTAADLQTAIIAAINGQTTTLRITAAAGSTTVINLTNDIPGDDGNQTTGDNVAATSFTITPNMSGGAAHNCAAGTGCRVDADCLNGTCLPTNLCN